jgi:hypothetical protein
MPLIWYDTYDYGEIESGDQGVGQVVMRGLVQMDLGDSLTEVQVGLPQYQWPQPHPTDAKLLAAIPQMKPWVANADKKVWALREAGRQILAYGKAGAELDMSGESGVFHLIKIDLSSGKVTRTDQVMQGGGKSTLPGGVVWLTKE